MSEKTALTNPSIPSPTAERQPPEPLVYNTEDLCEVLRMSLPTLHRLKSAGKLPRPLRLGGQLRWSASEIQDWIRAEMPDEQTWDEMRNATKNDRR